MGKDIDRLVKALRAQDFIVKRTSKGHWMVRTADGKAVATLSGTASDHRSWPNSLNRLRKAGLIWPPPKR